MEKLVEKGLVRSIGLSNFNSRQIDDVLSVASIKPTVLQVRRRFFVFVCVWSGHVWFCDALLDLAGGRTPLPGSGGAAGPLPGPRPGDDGL